MSGDQINPALMTVQQCASYLAVSERSIWTLIRDEKLPAVRFGKKLLRVERCDLDAFIKAAKGASR